MINLLNWPSNLKGENCYLTILIFKLVDKRNQNYYNLEEEHVLIYDQCMVNAKVSCLIELGDYY